MLTLFERVRSEPRDRVWAERIEAAIRTRLVSIPLVGKNGNVVRVTCASSLCELAGTLVSPKDKVEREDPKSSFNEAIKDLQVPPFQDDMGKLGLRPEGGSFMQGKGKPDNIAFLFYFSRKK